MNDTIFATSSGALPAGIAVIRVSGPHAGVALQTLSGALPSPRRASAAVLHDEAGDVLDYALVLWFPGPKSVTGEDVVEVHCHGGRAVVAAVEGALARLAGLRRAEPGEFTRRAFANGKIDLAEAEGLADLLASETEIQRKAAMAMAGGVVSRETQRWCEEVLALSASVEAALDFGDEIDEEDLSSAFYERCAAFAQELSLWLARPRASLLRDGVKVVIAGPPNAGKSSLFNALLEHDAAIVSSIEGTTRDVLRGHIALAGVPFVILDTAGLRDGSSDQIEAIGIDRARRAGEEADIVLWLGGQGEGPVGAWEITAKIDDMALPEKALSRHRLSVHQGVGLDALREDLVRSARLLLPKPGEAALTERQHRLVGDARQALACVGEVRDPLLVAEALRVARVAFDSLVGRTATEDMLDALFGQFCLGK